MARIVAHSVILVTSLSRVILIHYEMMFRHAQSLQCVSSWCIRLHEWHHSPRKYSLHPPLKNRHRSSCKSSKSAIEARDSTLCATRHSSSFESPSYQCNRPHNDHSYFKRNQCMQNRWNNPSFSFSKTTWNPCISHSVIANSSFYKSRNRCGLSFLHSLRYRAVCLSESYFKGHSRQIVVTIHSVTNQLSLSSARIECDELVVIVVGGSCTSFFPSSWLGMSAFSHSVTTQLFLWMNRTYVMSSCSRRFQIEHSVTMPESHLRVGVAVPPEIKEPIT